MQEIDIPFPAERNQRIADLIERRLLFDHPIERLACPRERDIVEMAAFVLLSFAGYRTKTNEHAFDSFGREPTCQVHTVVPESADGVERHKDSLWRVHRKPQQCASNSDSDAGRSSWMSLNALNAVQVMLVRPFPGLVVGIAPQRAVAR